LAERQCLVHGQWSGGEHNGETAGFADDRGDLAGNHVAAVAAHLGAPVLDQLRGRDAVANQQPVGELAGPLVRGVIVEHRHRAPGARQHQGAAQSRGATAERDHVVAVVQPVAQHSLPPMPPSALVHSLTVSLP
jgi:hypothetical protein